MIQVKTRLRRWGNSFGLVVPSKEVDLESLNEGDEIVVTVSKKGSNLKNLFGKHKFKKKTSEIMREIDRELHGE